MAQIPTQNPGSNEAQSALIAGITEGLNKLSSILNLKTSTLEDVSLTAVSIDDTEENKNRIFEANDGNRLWLTSPAPVFKKNGSIITQESSGFTIDYVGGSITFPKESKPSDGDSITVSATYIISESEQLESILSGLSSAQIQANKYKGNYASYDALILAIPSGSNGDFAIVFEPLAVYAWKNDGWYDTRSIEDLSNYYTKDESNNLLNQKEPSITQKGSSSSDDNYYWGGRKTWQDLFAKVRSVTLTGLSTASDAAVIATDTFLSAIGKLQAQVSKATQRAYLSGTGAPTTSTVGAVGQRYINTSNGDEYTCEAVSGSTYTWRMHTRSVNGKTPTVAGGNVQLTATDVGAATPQQIPNPNLGDNMDFTNPVNQRGKSAYYDNGYMIDRWVNNGSAYNVAEHYLASGSPDATKYIFQSLELSKVAKAGDTLTASANINGETISVTAEITAEKGASDVVLTSDEKASIGFSWNPTEDRIYFRINDLIESGAVFLNWAKLEKGEVATPWQPKGYEAEFVACLRFFERIGSAQSALLGNMVKIDGTNLLPVTVSFYPKRVAPTITFSDVSQYRVLYLDNIGGSTGATNVSAITQVSKNQSEAAFFVYSPNIPSGAVYAYLQRQDSSTAAWIDVSADL